MFYTYKKEKGTLNLRRNYGKRLNERETPGRQEKNQKSQS